MTTNVSTKKVAKKKNRKLRRQIRKTLGALLMVSAIAVAAIPVPDVSANPTDTSENEKKIKVAVTSEHGVDDADKPYESAVPYVKDQTQDRNNQVIYTSGDGMFKFAYIRGNGIVILEYDRDSSRESITIPHELKAFRNYSENFQGQAYFCLVSANDELLGYKLRNQPQVDENGRNYYRTTDRKPDGVTLDNLEKITDVEPDPDNPGGYCIYYMQTKIGENGQPEKDEDGNVVQIRAKAICEQMMGDRIYPCYYNQMDVWGGIDPRDLYYHPKVKGTDGKETKEDDYSKWELAEGNTNHWGIEAEVKYIGAEKVKSVGASWELVAEGDDTVDGGAYRDTPDEGVFRKTISLKNVNVEANLVGISDYAFYGCPQLSNVVFQAGLQTVGNGIFADCIALTDVTMPEAFAIGKDAFYNCQSLKNFNIPTGTLQYLGDCAFEGCTLLEKVDFLPADGTSAVALRYLGNHIFRNCTALISMEFPDHYFEDEALDIDMFQGCSSLQYVKLPNTDSGERIKFDSFHSKEENKDDYPNCKENTWEKFKETVPDFFYFEGPERGDIHSKANNNALTYKYPNEQLYERVEYEHDVEKDGKDKPDGKSAKVFYKVRVEEGNIGKLVEFGLLDRDESAGGGKSRPDIITIPEKIGTFGIASIESGSFNNNCDLAKVTIPASVTTIGADAFKGCHDLRTVIFTDATTITSIGADAFKTQEVLNGHCNEPVYPAQGAEKPYLYFVGAMLKEDGKDTETFKFAMSGADGSKISNDDSDDIWITCHSGWPTNLEVQYYLDPRTKVGEAQLVGYPRYDKIEGKTQEWANALPYVTSPDEAKYYGDMVDRAITFNQGGTINPPITPNEQAFLAATLNVVIPTSVNSIEPGLFSGYTYDKESGEAVLVDEEGNLVEIGADGKPVLNKDDNGKDIPLIEPDKNIKSILINGVDEVEPYTFKECSALQTADIMGSSLINDYAFDDCSDLNTVTLGSKVEDTGKRPFRACDALTQINCLEPSNFRYASGILYRTIDNGIEIVECLENRGMWPEITGPEVAGPDEFAGVTSIKPEAFQDCENLVTVDLSGTTVDIIPENCFRGNNMSNITLPGSLKEMHEGAFQDGSETTRLTVTYKGDGNVLRMDPDLFKQTVEGKRQRYVQFICPEKSNAHRYYLEYAIEDGGYIAWSDKGQEFTVRFWNLPYYPSKDNPIPLGPAQSVLSGEAAKEPEEKPTCLTNPELAFTGWDTNQYLQVQRDLDVYPVFGEPEFEVIFKDGLDRDVTIGEPQKVKYGRNPVYPTEEMIPKHDNYMFSGWDPELGSAGITKDTVIYSSYIRNDGTQFVITFQDYDGAVIGTQIVKAGENAMKPADPVREGYKFMGWVPEKNLENVTENRTVTATYERDTGGGSNPNPSGGGNGNNPNPSGGNGNNNNNNNNANSSASPRNSATPSAAPTATPANGNDVVKYTVTVSGGSGTGSYPAGAVVAINAYAMGVGQVFDKWTSSTAGVGFADATATSTTFTMPAANVAITATYKTGGAGTAATNASGGSGGGSSTGTVNNNGSTVEVSRPGISNTNLAGATVSGATDNFVVKVSEDQAATDAATAALQARFGDLSRIKYFPMDISLYDSTGRTKIADTSGISVNLTLPLPDELIQYAGNNKMAAISGGALEDLNARFTTVGGVPCINFTATHFSPYVIYVDTANLTEATIDSTPKTGDPIHPKWFLALGMACISLVLFFKRDKVVVKARA